MAENNGNTQQQYREPQTQFHMARRMSAGGKIYRPNTDAQKKNIPNMPMIWLNEAIS